MRIAVPWFAIVILTATVSVFTQAPAPGPTFDVVSIKRHVAQPGPQGFNSNRSQRPDGGFTMTNVFVTTLILRAYPYSFVEGLPAWATSERYDVSATSTLSQATPDDRIAMMRAMLTERFKLAVHFEMREQQVYDLVHARDDRKLGPGLVPIDTDCAPQIAAARAAFEAGPPPGPQSFPDLNAPPPPCTLRTVRGRTEKSDRMEGETTIAVLSEFLRMPTRRFVVDKTGLSGSYRMRMNFDMQASFRGPEVAPPPDAAADVFTALREQMWLKLEPSRAPQETLIIDRIERPTEN
jgi:uncharacterized protein (TIGR03435 family)